MTTLTSSAVLTVGDSTITETSTTLSILPAIGTNTGRGRLVHPTLGTYDYLHTPDEWVNIDGDVIIPPKWVTTKTLRGSANTLFVGDLRDVMVEERWSQDISAKMAHVRALLAFWQTPVDPSLGYVIWRPNYTSQLAFKVIMVDVTVGGTGVTLDMVSKQGWARGAVSLKMMIAGRES